ncbi:MAG: NUDIX hydrolase [Flavobacteriia bacterium]|nr:NUDIX hydrolase [Flavobacteriia bacterium]
MKERVINPNVSVDCAVFGFDNQSLKALLIEQKPVDGNPGHKALPGDLVLNDESLDDAASRVLRELTGIEGIFLRQFHTFGDPNRVKQVQDLDWLKSYRDNPDARVITVGYYALVKMDEFAPEASSFAESVFWQDIHEIPSLAFDHNSILDAALIRLREEFENRKVGFELLPEKFTLSQLQSLYEAIEDRELDKRNFRKKVLKEKLVLPLDEKQTGVVHKPARLYELNLDIRNEQPVHGSFVTTKI